jgi:UDP-2,3-diacylglucosamine pyrophosphatase LpxH
MKTVLICPDVHIPYEHEAAVKCLVRVCKAIQPDYFVCLGDLLDFYQLSRFDKDPGRKTTVSDDCDLARRWFYKVDAALPLKCEKVFIEGNHENRLQKWIWSNAMDLGKMIPSLPEYLHLKKLGWVHVPYGKLWRLGDVLYMHGDRCGMNVSMNMIRKYGCNVVHGHDHGAALRYFANAVTRMWALNCGHLSDMDQQEYLYGGVADWTMGFGLVEYTNDFKHAVPSFVPVIDGKAMVRGKLI